MESDRKIKCSACLHAPESVPYIAHESAQARMERIVKRLWISTILLIALLVGTNVAWLWYESQFETITVSQDIDTSNGDLYYRNNLLGAGDITNGAYNDDCLDPAA